MGTSFDSMWIVSKYKVYGPTDDKRLFEEKYSVRLSVFLICTNHDIA